MCCRDKRYFGAPDRMCVVVEQDSAYYVMRAYLWWGVIIIP